MVITVCLTCSSPHRGVHCDNPGCMANPTIPTATKVRWADERAKRATEEAERAMIRRAQASAMCRRAQASAFAKWSSVTLLAPYDEGSRTMSRIEIRCYRDRGALAELDGEIVGVSILGCDDRLSWDDEVAVGDSVEIGTQAARVVAVGGDVHHDLLGDYTIITARLDA